MKVIRIIFTLSLCNIALTSQAMFVRAMQPIAKRLASRLLTPRATSQTPSIQRSLQLPTRTVKVPSVKPASSFSSRSTQYMKLFKARPNYHYYYNSKSRWMLPAALGIGTLATSTLHDHAYAESDNNDQGKQCSVQEQYRNALEEEGAKLISEFLVAIGKTEEEWEQIKAKLQEPYLRAVEENIKEQIPQHNSLSPKFKNTIISLLKQHEINPQMVTFIRDDTSAGMGVLGAPVIGKIRFTVNERQCNCLTQKELEWVTLHEIQHLKHNDTFMGFITTNNRNANAILHKYIIFVEKRADILAALTSLEHAKAAADFSLRQWNVYSWHQKLLHALRIKNLSCEDGKHPAIEKCVTYTAKLYEEMLAEQNKNIAQNKQIN